MIKKDGRYCIPTRRMLNVNEASILANFGITCNFHIEY
jgi:hypothetical protein